MASYNCNSCDNLRENAPEFVMDGLNSTHITSLKNNTGLDPSTGNNDCDDLNDINDCLVGTFMDDVETFDSCEWKPFVRRFIPNLWTTIKSMIASICGLWENIESANDLAASYQLTKSGSIISLTAADGSHGTVIDETGGGGGEGDGDTTYTLTISGNSLSLNGSDESVSTVTLPTEGGGGGVTRLAWGLSADEAIPDTDSGGMGADGKIVMSDLLSLTEGIWIVVGSAAFAANGTGVRGMGVGLNGAVIGVEGPAASGHDTRMTKTYTFAVPAGGASLAMAFRQTSGGNLNVLANPGTYITAVRVG